MLTDSHTHLPQIEQRGLDLVSLLEGYSKTFSWIIDAGVDQRDFERRLEIAARFPFVRLACGIHPTSSESPENQIRIVTDQLSRCRAVAIGETGIDRYHDRTPLEIQEEMFRLQLELACETGLPVIIHNREADEDIVRILGDYPRLSGGVMHCFSGRYETLKVLLDRNFFFSFAGNLTYKKSDDIRDAAKRTPEDRILCETDAPWLAPQSMRGKDNHPGLIDETCRLLAEIRRIDYGQLLKQLETNFVDLFNP
jgi:TatD DNase family protein